MKQTLRQQLFRASLAIVLTLTLTQAVMGAQDLQTAQGTQLEVAQEAGAALQSEKSPKFLGNTKRIEGVWEAQVTVRVCQTGAPILTFRGMTSFIRGGSSIGTNSNPNPPTAFGRWKYLGRRRYIDVERFFRYNPDGSFAGVQRITRNITLSRDGDNFTGTISGEIFDVNDNLIGTTCATEVTKRVE